MARPVRSATISPAALTDKGETGSADGFYVRPEFRLFATVGSWNDAANNLGGEFGQHGASTNVNFGNDKKSGVTVGVQAEGWFNEM